MSVDVTWVGHATFEFITSNNIVVVIDPWYTNSPVATRPVPDHADFVLVTHDHWDHVTDVPELARRGAKVVTQPEVEARLAAEEGVPAASCMRINIGGTVQLTDDVRVTMIPAIHSARSGTPAGFILQIAGVTIAHLGDTALYSDLQMYGERFFIDLALVPAGDHFTMGPREAARASTYLRARVAAPMHYKTFAALVQSPEPFAVALKELGDSGSDCWMPTIGESRRFASRM